MSENYEVPYKELGSMGRAIDAYVLASVRAERERIIELLEANALTAASELIEQDALINGTVANNATVEPVGKTDKLGENK